MRACDIYIRPGCGRSCGRASCIGWIYVHTCFCGQARGNQTLSGSISMDESLIHASIFRKKRHESTLTSPAQSYFTVKQSNSEEAAFDEAEQMSLGDFNQSSGPF